MIIVLGQIGQILVLLHQPAMCMLSQTTITEGSDLAGTGNIDRYGKKMDKFSYLFQRLLTQFLGGAQTAFPEVTFNKLFCVF